VAGAGVALACAPKGGPVFAVKLGQRGKLTDSGLAWTSTERDVSTDVSTPLFYQGRFYVLNSDKRVLACVEPASGKVLWQGRLEGRAKIEASPTGADGKIYMISHRGEVFVAAAGEEFKVLHTAALGDDDDRLVRSSIVASGSSLFIRTDSKLYRLARSK
jgi:outer membrane protein assembly factor BamB